MSTDLGEMGGHSYRIGSRLSAERQFHVGRRVLKAFAPAGEQIVEMLPGVIKSLNRPDDEGKKPPFEAAKLLSPLMRAVGDMSDEDAEYVLRSCLSIVQRKAPAGETWTPVWDPGASAYRFSDIEMPHMVLLAVKVMQDQLSSFFPGGLSAFLAPVRKAP